MSTLRAEPGTWAMSLKVPFGIRMPFTTHGFPSYFLASRRQVVTPYTLNVSATPFGEVQVMRYDSRTVPPASVLLPSDVHVTLPGFGGMATGVGFGVGDGVASASLGTSEAGSAVAGATDGAADAGAADGPCDSTAWETGPLEQPPAASTTTRMVVRHARAGRVGRVIGSPWDTAAASADGAMVSARRHVRAASRPRLDDGGDTRRMTDPGFRVMSPLGFEITPDIEAEALADPGRMPSALQTSERRAQLIEDLGSTLVAERHRAIGQLAAWDPDPEVAAALRPLLRSDDIFEASRAASGLARQADVTDLPAVLRLVHELSPDEGGSGEAMIEPLRAALSLAALAGPEIVEGVKARARTWRGEAKYRRQSWEKVLDAELNELLGH